MAQAPQVLTQKHVQILRRMHFYRFMTALDVAACVYTRSQLGKVRNVLAELCGGADFQERQYLYRFALAGRGNSERVYTLGSRGRDYLAEEVGLPVGWYFRPDKVKHFSHAHIVHSLILTRTLIAAQLWTRGRQDVSLGACRISYELSEQPQVVTIKNREGRQERVKVVPDAWLRFDRCDGKKLPVILEIDRGREPLQAACGIPRRISHQWTV
jgi:protein involved in plasmid replication-relaxation